MFEVRGFPQFDFQGFVDNFGPSGLWAMLKTSETAALLANCSTLTMTCHSLWFETTSKNIFTEIRIRPY